MSPPAGIDVDGPVNVIVLPLTVNVNVVIPVAVSVTVIVLGLTVKPLAMSAIDAGGPHVTEPRVSDGQVNTRKGSLMQEPPGAGLPGLVSVSELLPGELTLKIGALKVGTGAPTAA